VELMLMIEGLHPRGADPRKIRLSPIRVIISSRICSGRIVRHKASSPP